MKQMMIHIKRCNHCPCCKECENKGDIGDYHFECWHPNLHDHTFLCNEGEEFGGITIPSWCQLQDAFEMPIGDLE